MIIQQRNFLFSILILLAVFFLPTYSDPTFQKRYTFSLGQNVKVAKFSADYTLLAVLRDYDNSVYSYNPMTFELIGSYLLEDGTVPVDLELFGNDILVTASNPNTLLAYQRKADSAQLTLKKRYPLTFLTTPTKGLKLQKLNQDLTDKSTLTKPRHLVAYSAKSFQLLNYTASQQTNKFASVFNKSYETTPESFTEFEFIDEKFMVFGLGNGGAGETQLLQLSKPSNITKVDGKLTYGMKSYWTRATVLPSDNFFLAMGHDDGVTEYLADNKGLKAGSTIINITKGRAFYDSNKILGFHNGSSVNIQKVHELSSRGFPSYNQLLSYTKQASQPLITIAAMPQNETGELIINNCQENNQPCFNYFSLCPADEYLTISNFPNPGTYTCKQCKITNCQKCFNGDCVMCTKGSFVESAKKCQSCNTNVYGCNDCSQNGKTCHACDTTSFLPVPVDNVCQCTKGNVYDLTGKKCVTCLSKISFCSSCSLKQDKNIYCNECQTAFNRVLSADGKSCVCNPNFYFENSTKQCQLCDQYQKCLHCGTNGQCNQCNSQGKWTLDGNNKCVCIAGFVEVNNQCSLCSSYITGCKTCSSTDKCSECDTSLNRNSTPTADGKCLCQSPYTQNSQKLCVLCSVPGCSNCQAQNVCNLCDTTLNRIATPTDGKCLCQATYTENSKQQCVLCTTPGCKNCETENMCTVCDTSAGFNSTVTTDGKCSCIATKYLDTDTCKDCSVSIFGCQLCSSGTTCDTCNSSLNFDPKPINSSCKCISNYFVANQSCVRCQMICEHCNKCVETIGEDLGTTVVGCSECEDGFEVKDLKCIEKSSSAWVYILIGLALLTIAVVAGVCYLKKKRAKKAEQQKRNSLNSQSSLVTMLLKQNDPQYMTSDRTQAGTKKSYQPLFSGNINYSISSQQRQADKKMFNESMRQLERQRKAEFDRRHGVNGYTDLSNNISINRKPGITEEEAFDKKKQGLFSHRGKG